MNKRHKPLLFFVAFLLFVSFLAYNKWIPREIEVIPFYDSIGHFVLFGFLGLAAHYAFEQRRVLIFGMSVPLGPTLAVVYAFLDESLQVLSVNRTFDLSDLFFGVLGICCFVSLASAVRHIKSFYRAAI